jgi:hypothetical protein
MGSFMQPSPHCTRAPQPRRIAKWGGADSYDEVRINTHPPRTTQRAPLSRRELFGKNSGELCARNGFLTLPNHFGDRGGAPHVVVPDRRRCRDSPGQNDEGIGAGPGRRNHPAKDDARIVQRESDFVSHTDHASNVGVARILLFHELLFLLFAYVRGKRRLTLELIALRLCPRCVFLVVLALLGLRILITHAYPLARTGVQHAQ